MEKDPHRYDDMLDLPHHRSTVHPHMSRSNRAAQFSPFAALTGYEDTIRETARLTDTRVELDENEKEILDRRFRLLMEHMDEYPELELTVFLPDKEKAGGSFQNITGIVKKISLSEKTMTLFAPDHIRDGRQIRISDITDIRGDLFRKQDEDDNCINGEK